MDDPRSILVINVTRIGDTLFVTPALRALAAHWPQARITVLAHPKRAEILGHLPGVARVGCIEKRRARFLGWLPGRSYDLAVVYGHDEPLLRYALRVARQVVAFRQGKPKLDERLYRGVEETLPNEGAEHPVERALRLVGSVGAAPQSRRLIFALTADERAWAADCLDDLGMSACRPLIGLQVASFATKSYRDWPVESFAALGRRVLKDYHGAGFLIFGGTVERERTEHLAAELGVRARSLAGTLSLRQTGALMSQLQAYVGVDTGPTHLMSSFDIPMVGLYHCRYPHDLWGPLEHPLDFGLDHPRRGSSAEADMAEMTVDSVYVRLQAALAAAAA